MRGGCAPLVCDDKVGRTFCNFCSLLRRVLRGVARTLAWMCILCGSVLRGHRKSLVNYSVHCKLNCCECPFLTVPSNCHFLFLRRRVDNYNPASPLPLSLPFLCALNCSLPFPPFPTFRLSSFSLSPEGQGEKELPADVRFDALSQVT